MYRYRAEQIRPDQRRLAPGAESCILPRTLARRYAEVTTCEGETLKPDLDSLGNDPLSAAKNHSSVRGESVAWLEARRKGSQLLLVADSDFCRSSRKRKHDGIPSE
ncbi:DUF1481 domain-containing protein [Salmonella enterica subsp. enterica]|nr:DUF1481 domain-containing protein [Salmonella enterica subsp. enterica]